MIRNTKNSNILNAFGLFCVRRRIVRYRLLESLNRKMETKIMITNLCISKGSRYEIQKNKDEERGGIAHLKKDNHSNKDWKLKRSHKNQ